MSHSPRPAMVAGVALFALAACAQASASARLDSASYPRLVLLFAALSVAPAILAVLTGFARIVTVLFFLRAGIGNSQIPPNTVIVGLAVFITICSMQPTAQAVYHDSVQPLLAGQADIQAAAEHAVPPLREYMGRRARPDDIALFAKAAGVTLPPPGGAAPLWALAPAYIVGELRTAFLVGFVVYLPFLVVDLVVGATLASLGMLNMSPTAIALPFKILLFITVDGWRLLTGALMQT